MGGLVAAAVDWLSGARTVARQQALARLRPQRLVTESRWVPAPLALAGTLRPRRLNRQPFRLTHRSHAAQSAVTPPPLISTGRLRSANSRRNSATVRLAAVRRATSQRCCSPAPSSAPLRRSQSSGGGARCWPAGRALAGRCPQPPSPRCGCGSGTTTP
jgi:hypothetical protein